MTIIIIIIIIIAVTDGESPSVARWQQW